MIPPWRRRARWWLTAGWLWFRSSHRAPTCLSPSESIRITCRRVGSLTCFRRIAAFWTCLSRCSAPFFALLALVVVDAAPLVAAAIVATPGSIPRRGGSTRPARLGNLGESQAGKAKNWARWNGSPGGESLTSHYQHFNRGKPCLVDPQYSMKALRVNILFPSSRD